jgi:hypothetical protein
MVVPLRFTPVVAALVLVLIVDLACDDDSDERYRFDASQGQTSVDAAEADAAPDMAPDLTPVACPRTTGPGTVHDQPVTADERWTAEASPHLVPADLTVYRTLTIEPCAQVRIGPRRTITVRDAGRLVAEGTPEQHIQVTALQPGQPFASISNVTGNFISLAYVDLDGGGDPLNSLPFLAGTLNISGADQTATTAGVLKVDHVTIGNYASNGIVLRGGGGFAPGSTSLTIKGAAQWPVSIWARAVSTLPDGAYTGNTHDEILLPTDAAYSEFVESTTLRDRGVPYRVGHANSAADLRVDPLVLASNTPVLTIEPGVVLRFKKGGVLRVTASTGTQPARAVLVAVGTAAKPIVFTSAEANPSAGDWLGIYFGQVPLAANRIEHAVVSFAGGASASGSTSCLYPPDVRNDAAIRLFGNPGRVFVSNTVIADSAGYGIDRGYSADTSLDFTATNTFTRVARCPQSVQRVTSTPCPAMLACP